MADHLTHYKAHKIAKEVCESLGIEKKDLRYIPYDLRWTIDYPLSYSFWLNFPYKKSNPEMVSARCWKIGASIRHWHSDIKRGVMFVRLKAYLSSGKYMDPIEPGYLVAAYMFGNVAGGAGVGNEAILRRLPTDRRAFFGLSQDPRSDDWQFAKA